MASRRGRDLTISILSDLEDFQTDKAARDLEDLGDSAKDMGEEVEDAAKKVEKSLDDIKTDKAEGELKDLEDQADKTAKGMEDDFDATAKKIDGAFDKIAASSRSNLRKVDDDARRAKGGMDEFGDETTQVGREASTSFTGDMEDITDALRDVSANALSTFGPAGAFVGIAAAAGVGLVVAALQSAAEEANEAKENTSGLAAEILEAGGALDRVDFEGRMQAWSLEIADNVEWWEVWQKEAVTNVEMVQRALDDGSTAAEGFLSAMASPEAEHLPKVLADVTKEVEDLEAAQQAYVDTHVGVDLTYSAEYQALEDSIAVRKDLIPEIEAEIKARADAAEQARIVKEALIEEDITRMQAAENFGKYRTEVEATTEQMDLAGESYRGTTEDVDEFAVMTESAAERHGTAVDDIKTDIEELGTTQVLNLADLNAAMEEHLAATRDFHTNQMQIVEEFGEDGIAAVQAAADTTGLSIAEVSQMLVTASEEDKAEFIENWGEAKTQAGDQQELADAMAASKYKVKAEAAVIHDEVEGVLAQDITMPTKVSNITSYEAALVRQDAASKLGTVTIPTRLGTPGNYNLLRRTWA